MPERTRFRSHMRAYTLFYCCPRHHRLSTIYVVVVVVAFVNYIVNGSSVVVLFALSLLRRRCWVRAHSYSAAQQQHEYRSRIMLSIPSCVPRNVKLNCVLFRRYFFTVVVILLLI